MEKISSNNSQSQRANQRLHQRNTARHHAHINSAGTSNPLNPDKLVKIAREKHFFIFGNLATGKTTVMKKIAEALQPLDTQCFTLDTYREKAFRDYPNLEPFKKEKAAQKMMIKDMEDAIGDGKILIMEGTYITHTWQRIFQRFRFPLYIIKTSADRNICFQRYAKRQEEKGFNPALALLATKKANTSFHKSYDAIAFKHHRNAHLHQADEIIFT